MGQQSNSLRPQPAEVEIARETLLTESAQRRNSLVFLLNHSLNYLVAPVFYIGVLHAAILDSLGASKTVANLPEAASLWVMPVPLLISWLWPSPRLLRPMLTAALLVNGTAGLIVAGLFLGAPRAWLIPALIGHAALVGITNGVRQMCLWELLGRDLTPARRARTLGWTFGLGPAFAVLGSCATQLILSGQFLDLVQLEPVPPPWSYIILFGATGPAMVLAALLVALVNVPTAPEPAAGGRITAILHGLRAYFLNPLIVITALGFLLTYGGTMILPSLSLYARQAIGVAPEQYAGLQLALRFGCKSLSGFTLGWLVARLHAKASLMATTGICMAGIGWALLAPGKWYLLSFGFLGAGELFYIYYINYIITCSAPERIRESTAYTNLLTAIVGFFPVVFGLVSDYAGLQSSFVTAIGVLAAALLLVGLWLPRQPTVRS